MAVNRKVFLVVVLVFGVLWVGQAGAAQQGTIKIMGEVKSYCDLVVRDAKAGYDVSDLSGGGNVIVGFARKECNDPEAFETTVYSMNGLMVNEFYGTSAPGAMYRISNDGVDVASVAINGLGNQLVIDVGNKVNSKISIRMPINDDLPSGIYSDTLVFTLTKK